VVMVSSRTAFLSFNVRDGSTVVARLVASMDLDTRATTLVPAHMIGGWAPFPVQVSTHVIVSRSSSPKWCIIHSAGIVEEMSRFVFVPIQHSTGVPMFDNTVPVDVPTVASIFFGVSDTRFEVYDEPSDIALHRFHIRIYNNRMMVGTLYDGFYTSPLFMDNLLMDTMVPLANGDILFGDIERLQQYTDQEFKSEDFLTLVPPPPENLSVLPDVMAAVADAVVAQRHPDIDLDAAGNEFYAVGYYHGFVSRTAAEIDMVVGVYMSAWNTISNQDLYEERFRLLVKRELGGRGAWISAQLLEEDQLSVGADRAVFIQDGMIAIDQENDNKLIVCVAETSLHRTWTNEKDTPDDDNNNGDSDKKNEPSVSSQQASRIIMGIMVSLGIASFFIVVLLAIWIL
jgi:hypothetical protein